MPVPYSDNLYSVLAEDDDDSNNQTTDTEQEDVLSPADGYFHASSSDAPSSSQPQPDAVDAPHHRYPNVPVVPNVLVEDPTLREQDAGAKAREAEEESRLNNARGEQESSPSVAQPQPSTHTRLPSHHHRRSVEEDEPSLYTAADVVTPAAAQSHQYAQPTAVSPVQDRPAFQPTPSDAPPAYTPRSPTSPTSPPAAGPGYQTFGPVGGAPQPAVMGVPEEQQALLPREPESMGGTPGEQRGSWWRRFRESWTPSGASMRRKVQTILGTLLVLSILAMLIGAFTIKPHDDGDWNVRLPEPSVLFFTTIVSPI
jgi:hypothetical protein